MSNQPETNPPLPASHPDSNYKLPPTNYDNWFSYPIKVHPHHTDYAGVVWHGTYITWMEEARIECLRSIGIDFADLVALGCDLPVVELSIKYHIALRLGMSAILKTRLHPLNGVRIKWDYQIMDQEETQLFVSAQVTLVAVDIQKGKIIRQLPSIVKDALTRLATE